MADDSNTNAMRLVAPLGHEFWRDSQGRIYFGHSRDERLNVIRGNYLLKGADAASFQVLNAIWARDASRVYAQASSLRADRNSFEVLNAIYARDRESVYYLGGRVKGVDRDSFEVLDSGEQPGGPCTKIDHLTGTVSRVDYYGYARDRSGIYYHEKLCGKPRLIRFADRTTFEVVVGDYGRDKDWIFLRETRVRGADRATFESLGGGYYRDRRHIFYDTRIIREADRDSFTVVDPERHYARDKNHLYSWDTILRPVEYLDEISRSDDHCDPACEKD